MISILMQLLQKISQGFFYGFVFFLPWQTLYLLREVFVDDQKWEYGTIALYLSDLFLAGFLICWFILYYLKSPRWTSSFTRLSGSRIATIMAWAFCLVAYLFAGVFWSSDPILTFYGALKVACGVCLIGVLWSGEWNIRAIVVTLVASMVGHALLGIYQFLSQGDFASTLLGVSEHVASAGGTSVIESAGSYGQGRFLRGYGGFAHPNILGSSCAIMAILSLGGILVWGKSRRHRLFLLVASIVLFAGVLVSFSRSGLIVFFCGLSGLAFFKYVQSWRHGDSRSRLMFLRIIGGFIIGYGSVFLLFLVTYGDLFSTRIQGDSRLEQLSFSERTSQFSEASRVIHEEPLLGTGLGVYTKQLMDFDDPIKPIWQYQAVHNSYVLALSEIGIVGSLLLGFLSLSALRYVRQLGLRFTEYFFSAPTAIAVMIFLFSAFFDHWQWGSHFGVMFGSLLIGLTFSQYKKFFTKQS